MRISHLFRSLVLLTVVAGSLPLCAQEFPVANGSDNTFAGGGAYDGTKFLLAIVGDATNQYNITAQFISGPGVLSGPRISLGATGSSPLMAFDGTNYLVVWTDPYPMFGGSDIYATGDVHGRFVSTTGTLPGSIFTVATGVNIKFAKGRGSLSYRDTTYLVTYTKDGEHIDHLYGQRVSRTGSLLGSPVQISGAYARDHGIAFDGTNYLVAWCEVNQVLGDRIIYGQFVTPAGTLVGSNFQVDGGPLASDNPVNVAYDGTRYLVSFHEQAASGETWNLFGRFVSTSGTPEGQFLICDSTRAPMIPMAAFGGSSYLITWMEQADRINVKGRYFSASGIPLAPGFVVFDTLGGKFPLGGVSGYVDGRFFLGATRVDQLFSDADVYAMSLGPLTGVDNDGIAGREGTFALFQNYPNPFNPTTTIRYNLPEKSAARLTVSNMLGQQIALLFQGEQLAGYHEVKFDGSKLASGVYFYRLQAGNFVQTRKVLLLK